MARTCRRVNPVSVPKRHGAQGTAYDRHQHEPQSDLLEQSNMLSKIRFPHVDAQWRRKSLSPARRERPVMFNDEEAAEGNARLYTFSHGRLSTEVPRGSYSNRTIVAKGSGTIDKDPPRWSRRQSSSRKRR